MEAARDSDWLQGESQWYPSSDSIPKILKGEVQLPSNWEKKSSTGDNIGWMRQRLYPLGTRILFSTAWAPFFLIISFFPLLSPGNTPNDQNVSLGLFICSWLLLIVPFFRLRQGIKIRAKRGLIDPYPFEFLLVFLGIVLFSLHIIIDPRIGWLAYIIFLFAQYRTIRNITVCVSVNSARWLIPINPEFFCQENLRDGWIISSKFRNGPIAYWDDFLPDYSADLFGVTRGESKFIAFTLTHRGGTLHDPFSENFANDELFSKLLSHPPIIIDGEIWPDRFLNRVD